MYNITEYMSFHPGGEDELIRGVGTDATKLFNNVISLEYFLRLRRLKFLISLFLGSSLGELRIIAEILHRWKTENYGIYVQCRMD